MVQEAVEEADGGRLLGEEVPPVLEGPVRGDRQRTPLVGSGDQSEEELGAGVLERGEADLVDLSRRRDRSTYADTATIPTRGGKARRWAVSGWNLSG